MKFYRVSYEYIEGTDTIATKSHYVPSRGKAKKFVEYFELEGASKDGYRKGSAEIHDERWANKQGALDYLNNLEG